MSNFLRDEFAKSAMQSLITASVVTPGEVANSDSIAKLAYVFAESMLKHREELAYEFANSMSKQREEKEVEDGLV